MRIARPARRWISSALRLSTSQVPPPTTPMPSKPTLMGLIPGFMPAETGQQVALDVRPLGREHAVHHGVADGAVSARPVVADDAVLLRAERLDRALRAEIEVVGAQANYLAADFLEAELEQQQLAGGVHVAALPARRVPGVADLDAVRGRDDVVVARAADDRAALRLDHRPGQHVAGFLAFDRGRDVGARLLGLGHAGVPELPQLAVPGGLHQALLVLLGERLEPHAVA